MPDEYETQPVKRATGAANYFPDSKTAVLSDSNNRETIIRDVTQQEFNKMSNDFLTNAMMSSTTTMNAKELSKSLAASDLSSLMGAGVSDSEATENKNRKKSD